MGSPTLPGVSSSPTVTKQSTSGPGFIPGTGRLDIYNLGELGDPNIGYPIRMDSVTQPGYVSAARDRSTGDAGVMGAVKSPHPGLQVPVQMTPVQMMDNMALWGAENPDLLLDMRRKLYARGFYGSGMKAEDLNPLRTAVGDSDFKALGDAIKGYYAYINAKAASGATGEPPSFNQWLAPKDEHGNPTSVGPVSGGGTGAQPVAPQYDLATAQQVGDQNGQALLGHSLTSDQAGGLQGALNTNSQDQFAQGQNDNPSAFARSWLVSNNMDEYKQHQATSYMNTFLNLLGGNGTAANTAVGDVAVG